MRDSRAEREAAAREVAPASADDVIARMLLRATWLRGQLANVSAWQAELETLDRMLVASEAAKAPKSENTYELPF